MVQVSEVIVGLKSEGAADTKDDLDSVSDKTEETTAALDEQSDEMTDMAQTFSGALQAATVGLAAASAGLLSQVPVLGQLFDGLFAIVEAVALQMDQVLRPVLGPLSKKMFGLAESISKAEGTTGDLIGVFGTIVAVLGTIIGFVASAAVALGQGGALVSAATTLASVIAGAASTIAGAVSAPVIALGALTVALFAFYAAMLTNFNGFRDKFLGTLKMLAKDFVEGFKNFLKRPVKTTKNFASDMLEAGRDFIDSFIEGMKNGFPGIRNAISDAMGIIDEYIPGSPADTGPLSDLDQAGPGLVNEFAGGITSNLGQLQSAGSQAADAADGRGQGGQLPGSRSTTTKVYLNGREVGRGTNGERFDESARRGQTF